MVDVRVAEVRHVLMWVLVVLVDEAGGRMFPLWLRHQHAYGLLAPGKLVFTLVDSTGQRVESVRVDRLGDQSYASEVRLDTRLGEQVVKAGIGEGLAMARHYGCPVLIDDDLMDELGLSLADHGSLERAVDAAITAKGIPLPGVVRKAERSPRPCNLDFSDGLRGWELRGSFLTDFSENHVGDYTCGTGDGGGYLKAQVRAPFRFADLRQVILADDHRGRAVRLAADLRTVDVVDRAALFLSVLTPETHGGARERAQQPRRGTTDWAPTSIEADVPLDATMIIFGVTLTGPGQIWLRNAALTPCG
ncbi:bifunctional nuclease domain-containing protein [Thermopolyspora sp. NPDC052614]|uniref:bifunctional nuclease domain-containing protein n=1 Tax=Thermopolyspora sp. NPDC052614 TaxID=3155682 RepID=UPI00343BBB19